MFRRYSLFENTSPRLSVLPFTTSRRSSVTTKPTIVKVDSVPDEQQTQQQQQQQQLNLLQPNDHHQRKTRSLDNSPVKPRTEMVAENCPASNEYCCHCGYKLIYHNADEVTDESLVSNNWVGDKFRKNENLMHYLIDDKIDGSLFSCHKRNSHQQRRVIEEKLGRSNKTSYLTNFKRNSNSQGQQRENSCCCRKVGSSASSTSSTFNQGLVYQKKKHSLPETVCRSQYNSQGSQPPTVVHNCLMIRRRSEFYNQFNPSLFRRCTVRKNRFLDFGLD